MPRLPFDPFGPIAPVYERVHGHVAEEVLRHLLAMEPGTRLLDLGGGTGRVALRLQPDTACCVVLDPSHGMLGQAARRPGLHPVRGVAERLPFPDGAFERVLCVDAFHHFRDQRSALRESARVLAPGGLMVIQEFNVATLTGKIIRAAEAALLMGSTFLRPGELEVMAAETGLQSEVYNSGAREYFLVAMKARADLPLQGY